MAGPAPQSPANVGTPPISPGAPGGSATQGDPSLALPHERDESIKEDGLPRRAVIEQAAKDLAAGQVDTDMRDTPGLDAERRDALVEGGEVGGRSKGSDSSRR